MGERGHEEPQRDVGSLVSVSDVPDLEILSPGTEMMRGCGGGRDRKGCNGLGWKGQRE